MSRAEASRKRGAIYTRKSSEEGLDQEFNSLAAPESSDAAGGSPARARRSTAQQRSHLLGVVQCRRKVVFQRCQDCRCRAALAGGELPLVIAAMKILIHTARGKAASGNAAAATEQGIGYQAGLSLAAAMTFSYLAIRHMLG